MTDFISQAYRKRRLKRFVFEKFNNYRYSKPGLHGLDSKLEAYIMPRMTRRPGFFIEAGANDGFSQSNTYYFARRYGWKGLLVEPTPELAAHCAKIRPESIVVSCALGSSESEGEPVQIHRAGLMSTVDGALDDQEAHLRQAQTHQPGACEGIINTNLRSLSSIIDEQHPSGEIDLLSLDVEGYEPQVLSGLDLSRHRPRFICVESRDDELITQMLEKHYHFIDRLSHHDLLFEAKERTR